MTTNNEEVAKFGDLKKDLKERVERCVLESFHFEHENDVYCLS